MQWTIYAKKSHPVMLDVLAKSLRLAEEIREKEGRGEAMEIPGIVR